MDEWKTAQAQVSELKQKRAAVAANSSVLTQEDASAPAVPPPPVPVPLGVVRVAKLSQVVFSNAL